jgi:hypothetical protein
LWATSHFSEIAIRRDPNFCGSSIFAMIEVLVRHSKINWFLIEGPARGRPLLRRNRLTGGLRCSALGMLGETLLM